MSDQPQNLSPHSVEAEEAVLGSVLLNQDCYAPLATWLKADAFFLIQHKWLWEAYSAIAARGQDIDYITVLQELQAKNRLVEVGGPGRITHLTTQTPTHLHAETYARIVYTASIRRQLLSKAGEIAKIALEEDAEIGQVLAKADATLQEVTRIDVSDDDEPTPIASSVWDHYEDTESRAKDYTNGVKMRGVPSGFTELDALTGGWQKETLTTIAARPGVGKSALMVCAALNACGAEDAHIYIASLEMSKTTLNDRILSILSGINSQHIRTGNMAGRWDAYNDAVNSATRMHIVVDDRRDRTIGAICRSAEKYADKHGLDMLMVDYCQLVKPDTALKSYRTGEIAQVTRGLRELAGKLHIPVIMLAQVNREVEKRSDKRPQLSDLAESASIEADSDLVMFIYRDEMYNENSDRVNQADIIIGKHRNGPLDTVTLFYRKELTLFSDMRRAHFDLSKPLPEAVYRGGEK